MAGDDIVFDRLSRARPDDAWLWAGRAEVLLDRGGAHDPLVPIEKAVGLDPREPAFRLVRGGVLASFNRWQEAGPDFVFAAQHLDYGQDEILPYQIAIGLAASITPFTRSIGRSSGCSGCSLTAGRATRSGRSPRT
jgi:hypothetical protein